MDEVLQRFYISPPRSLHELFPYCSELSSNLCFACFPQRRYVVETLQIVVQNAAQEQRMGSPKSHSFWAFITQKLGLVTTVRGPYDLVLMAIIVHVTVLVGWVLRPKQYRNSFQIVICYNNANCTTIVLIVIVLVCQTVNHSEKSVLFQKLA